jgi:hypothetical protein
MRYWQPGQVTVKSSITVGGIPSGCPRVECSWLAPGSRNHFYAFPHCGPSRSSHSLASSSLSKVRHCRPIGAAD